MRNSIAPNVASYDTGNKPFKHDVGRGKWSSTWDFYAVALSHCFGFRHFATNMYLFRTNAIFVLLAYIFGMLTLVLPLYFTQMFMGQFTSTGSISVFRIAPLFKGIGYLSLILNLVTSSYVMVTAAFPLHIIFDSFQPYLPWSHCNNTYNTETCTLINPVKFNKTSIDILMWDEELDNSTFPIHEYIDHLIKEHSGTTNWGFSWTIMLCTFLVWSLIALVHYKGVEMFGKIYRYATPIMLICILLSTIRILCLKESWEAIKLSFSITHIDIHDVFYLMFSPLLAATTFGIGWGNVLTIASYNNFKEDIGKLSFVICFFHIIIAIIIFINFVAVDHYLDYLFRFKYYGLYGDPILYSFNVYAFYFSLLDWPHFWTIIFFLAVFISQFSEGAIQFLSILTAIFDEFEYTRIYKKYILGGLVVFFAFLSIFFCTSHAFSTIFTLHDMAGANKLIIILIELFVILWIYGRVRFQRDVKFMTGKQIQSWKIWMMRFLVPILILFSLIIYTFSTLFLIRRAFIEIAVIFLALKILPYLYIPVYMIYKLYTSTGNILNRIQKLCRPTDWYPADPIHHQNYENFLGNSDITNELVHANMETEVIVF